MAVLCLRTQALVNSDQTNVLKKIFRVAIVVFFVLSVPSLLLQFRLFYTRNDEITVVLNGVYLAVSCIYTLTDLSLLNVLVVFPSDKYVAWSTS